MRVIKRNGDLEEIAFDKILNRIKKLGLEANINVNYSSLTIKVIDQLYDKIHTTKIDELTADHCISLSTHHPDYANLAGRIVISNHQKNTSPSFSEVMKQLYYFYDIHGEHSPIVSQELWEMVSSHRELFDEMVRHERDYLIDFFGFKTLERAYLCKVNNIIVERPQYMWMRVAIGIHGTNIDDIKETYDLMSQKYFTHATPTLFNAGSPRPQLSSCFLQAMENDSVDGIYNTLKECAQISKYSGGIGLHIHNIRCKNSHIRGTNGKTDGIVPMLKVFNSTARYINQCFTPETIVYSKDGPKQMKDITTSDELITLDGTFKRVNEIIINKVKKEILEIRIKYSMFPVRVTKEHEIYLIKNQPKILKFSVIKNRLIKNIIKPDFYCAENLENNDFVGFPIPTFVKDNNIEDIEYYKFYGMMLGDGHSCKNRNEQGITLGNDTKKDLQLFVKEYLNKNKIHYWENEHPGCLSIKWSGDSNLMLNRECLYDENNNKYITDDFMHLPENKILKILEGLLRTDGSNLKELVFTNSSKKLIIQMKYLFLRLGILTSGYVKNNIGESHVTIHGRTITTKKISYCLRIPKHQKLESIIDFVKKGRHVNFFEWNGILWSRIRSITKIEYEGDVYDFNMIDNHNYLTDMGIVHNSGKRNGSFAIYLEPWHGDIESFLEMRKNHGDEEMKARDLFYALWVPDLFMERIKENKKWSLFCPDECPGLSDVYGSKFKELYETYESSGKARKTVEARDLWFKVLDAQMETGTPYLLYKDAANMKSNQKNIGTIKSSNLCVAPETLVLTDNGQIPIHELECKEIKVWNGQRFSDTMVFKTGENQELIEVETSDGCVLHCTPYHRFFIENKKSTAKDKEASIVEAQHLTINDVIVACDYPIIDGETHLETFDINIIPQGSISMESKMKWLSLFCEKYGVVSSKINLLKSAISIMHKNKETLMDVKHLLQTCGINAPLSKTSYYNYLYPDTAYYTLKINSTQLKILMDNGLRYSSPIITALLQKKYDDVTDVPPEPIKVIRITSNGRKDDTYCFNEPLNHAGIFNGILTSQCTEIIQVSDEKETSVCNLASIGLPTCVDEKTRTFDYEKLHQVTKVITKNLNKIIDINYYPTAKSQRSNLLNRPIGIGVQGLADVFMMMDVPFHSDLAKKINIEIFETIYHAALEKSNEIAIDRHNKLKRFHSFYNNLKTLSPNKPEEYVKTDLTFEHLSELNPVYGEMNNLSNERCGAYSSFEGSPASLGYLQFDLWNVVPATKRYDWSYLKQSIRKFGLRNSLLLAPMPTASTSQILGFNECFEPITSNIYSRSTLAGEFILANKYLMNDLIGLGLWNERIKDNIIANKGSIQQLTVLPQHIRDKYKIVWEIPMKHVIDMSAERGAYICQSQSLNLWLEDPNYNTLTSMHFYAWKKGLKTGIYYLRRKAKHQAQQFSIEPERKQEDENKHDEICEMCSA